MTMAEICWTVSLNVDKYACIMHKSRKTLPNNNNNNTRIRADASETESKSDQPPVKLASLHIMFV